MYLTNPSRAKNLRRTKDEPRMNLRTPKYKMCFLLRLPSLFPFLYLALFYQENTDRRPREDREKSASTPRQQKVLFLKIDILKKIASIPKKVTSFPKKIDYITKIVDIVLFVRIFEYIAISSLFINPESHSGIPSL